MSASAERDTVVKKKHVRFASVDDNDDNDDQEEDTLFDKRKDTGRGLKSALKAARRSEDRVEMVGGGGGRFGTGAGAGAGAGTGTCGRWTVTLALCASFLGLVNDPVPPCGRMDERNTRVCVRRPFSLKRNLCS